MVRVAVVRLKIILNLDLRHLIAIARTAVVPPHVVLVVQDRVRNQILDIAEVVVLDADRAVLEDVVVDVQDAMDAVVVVRSVLMVVEHHVVGHAVEVVTDHVMLHHNKMNERIDIKNG